MPALVQVNWLHLARRGMVITAAAALIAFAPPARAQDIAVGVTSAVTSIDPHFHNLSSNISLGLNIFDRLIHQDAQQRLAPGLATAWKAINDTTWEFTLRQGVTFHDGTPFGAEDVAASIRRVRWVPNSPGSFLVYTRAITEVIVVDDHTIRFKTASPYPLLPVDLSSISIVPRSKEQAPTSEFNGGQSAIGTGPFIFSEYIPGNRLVLRRNDRYWGEKPAWQTATIRMMPVNSSRVAALLAGDVQAIDNVPPNDAAQLRNNPAIQLERIRSNSVLLLSMDSFRDQTPFVTDKAGNPLPANPLKDVRVRRALSKAINRGALTERLMEGGATPAGQLLSEGFFGYSPNVKPDAYDPEGARSLLTEAGYPDGFAMTVHGPNDRYINDAKVLQAVGTMFTRIGIDTKVVTQPWSVFITQASAPLYSDSVMLVGNNATTGEASFGLRAHIATVDLKAGLGSSNRARYSNPQVDAVLAEAMRTVDDGAREKLLQQASEISMADQAILPLYHVDNVFATRKGYTLVPRADGFLPVASITPQ